MTLPGYFTEIGYRLWRVNSLGINDHLIQLSLASSRLGEATAAGWQVTLCDPMACDFQIVERWRFGALGSDVDQINEIILRRARLVLGWVTVSEFNSSFGKFISV